MLYGMDTIYNFGLGQMQHGSCVLGQLGLADKIWIVYTTKGSKAMASEFCEMGIQMDIVGRQYNLLRWMVFD